MYPPAAEIILGQRWDAQDIYIRWYTICGTLLYVCAPSKTQRGYITPNQSQLKKIYIKYKILWLQSLKASNARKPRSWATLSFVVLREPHLSRIPAFSMPSQKFQRRSNSLRTAVKKTLLQDWYLQFIHFWRKNSAFPYSLHCPWLAGVFWLLLSGKANTLLFGDLVLQTLYVHNSCWSLGGFTCGVPTGSGSSFVMCLSKKYR